MTDPQTSSRIEQIIERKFDALDRKYTSTPMTERDYELACARINQEADRLYGRRVRSLRDFNLH